MYNVLANMNWTDALIGSLEGFCNGIQFVANVLYRIVWMLFFIMIVMNFYHAIVEGKLL